MNQHPARFGLVGASARVGERGAILKAPPAPVSMPSVAGVVSVILTAPPAPCLPHPPSQRGAGRLSCPGCGDALVDGVCAWCQEQPFVSLLELRQKWWPL